MTKQEIQAGIEKLAPWFHRIELPEGLCTKEASYAGEPADHPIGTWEHVRKVLPEDLSGKRLIDIGCNGGFYSIEARRRGAQVIGVDAKRWQVRQAQFVSSVLGLEGISFQRESLYSLSAKRYGQFDVVLALGLIYHLKHLIKGLEKLFDMCAGLLIIETAVLPQTEEVIKDPVGHSLYPVRYVKNDPSKDEAVFNWFIPSVETVKAMLEDVGFSNVRIHDLFDGRGVLTAEKRTEAADSRYPAFLAADITADRESLVGRASEQITLAITAKNTGRGRWLQKGEGDENRGAVGVSMQIASNENPLFDHYLPGCPLENDVEQGESYSWNLSFALPSRPGNYILEVDLVSEHVNFFQDSGSESVSISIHVEDQ